MWPAAGRSVESHASRPCWASSRSGYCGSVSAPCKMMTSCIHPNISTLSNLSCNKSSPLPHLLPPSYQPHLSNSPHLINLDLETVPCRTTLRPNLQHRSRSNSHLRHPRPSHHHHLRLHRPHAALPPSIVGQLPRYHGHCPRLDSVLPADLHDPAPKACRKPEYPNDVYPDARQLRVGGESGGAVGDGRMERVGAVYRDGTAAGLVACHGRVL